MNALSLHQPWALAMALGLKSIETRSWRPPERCIRERFVIASTKRRPPLDDMRLVVDSHEAWNAWHEAGFIVRSSWPHVGGEVAPGPLGCIVASGVLADAVPITTFSWKHEGPFIADLDGDLVLVKPGDPFTYHSIESERAWGDFSPGRWAWLFTDLARVEDRCPWCWGSRRSCDLAASCVCHKPRGGLDGSPCLQNPHPCPVCDGRGSCALVPVKGKQRVWQWEPA